MQSDLRFLALGYRQEFIRQLSSVDNCLFLLPKIRFHKGGIHPNVQFATHQHKWSRGKRSTIALVSVYSIRQDHAAAGRLSRQALTRLFTAQTAASVLPADRPPSAWVNFGRIWRVMGEISVDLCGFSGGEIKRQGFIPLLPKMPFYCVIVQYLRPWETGARWLCDSCRVPAFFLPYNLKLSV